VPVFNLITSRPINPKKPVYLALKFFVFNLFSNSYKIARQIGLHRLNADQSAPIAHLLLK